MIQPPAPPSRDRRPLAGLALCLAAWLVTPGCDGQGTRADEGQGPDTQETGVRERSAAKVIAEALQLREMRRTLETTTVLESEREVALVPRAAGIVMEVLVEEGDAVAANQVLARMDDRAETLALRDAEISVTEARQALKTVRVGEAEADNRIATAKVNLAQAERDLERDERLLSGSSSAVGSVSLKAVEATRLVRDQAVQELASSELALQRAKLEGTAAATSLTRAELASDQASLSLRLLQLEAPFAGVIASRSIRVGDMATGAEPAFVLTDSSQVRAVFFRPQRELEVFRSTDDAPLELTATAEAVPGATFTGHVQRISPTVDSASGNFRVTASINPVPIAGGPPRLLPGMLLRVEIVLERRPDSLTVAKRAVVREGEQAYVFAIEGDVVRKVAVEEGFTDTDHVEITSVDDGADLQAGTEVVLVGARELEDGDPVEVQRLGQAAPEPLPEPLPEDLPELEIEKPIESAESKSAESADVPESDAPESAATKAALEPTDDQ